MPGMANKITVQPVNCRECGRILPSGTDCWQCTRCRMIICDVCHAKPFKPAHRDCEATANWGRWERATVP